MEKEKKMPEWDLSEYYNSVDDPKIDEDIKKYAEKAAEFAARYRGKVAKLEAGEFAAALRELEELCGSAGVGLTVVPTVYYGGVKVSSTAVKNFLLAGDMAAARAMLVTPYHIRGDVVSGDGRGHNIGIPTINMRFPSGVTEIRQGVYGTYAELGGKRYRAVTNVGPRPTFMQNKFAVETNLIGYEGGSLLHERATVYFYRYLRPIRKYADAAALVARIQKDKEWKDLC